MVSDLNYEPDAYPDDPASLRRAEGFRAAAALSDENVELEYEARLLEDFRFFCLAEYRVQNNNPNHPTAALEEWIPFEWNSQQERLAEMIAQDLATGRPMQYIILKSRQWGCTTFIKALNNWFQIRKPGTNIQILAQDSDATETIYELYEDCYDDLQAHNADWVPQKISGNKKTGWPLTNKSRLRIQTAGTEATAKKVGRSKTNTILHLSEEAFWTAGRKTLTAILQTVTLGPGKGIFRESTPNGASGTFYEAWEKAKKGKNDYRAVFVAWHDVEWNQLRCTDTELADWNLWRETKMEKFRERGGFEEDEDNRIEEMGLSPEQWKWWGWALHNKCDSDPDVMRQEYPDDDVSCFLESGAPVFRPRDIARAGKDATAPQRYELWSDAGKIGYRPDRRGQFRVWELPQEGASYLIAADVCGGFSSRDRSIAAVFLRTPKGLVQVAAYTGKPEPDEFAGYIYLLHLMYNRALVAPETNTYGKSVVDYLKRMGCNRFYRRKAYDQVTRQYTSIELGWHTSSTSRPTLIAAGKKYLREGLLQLKDREAMGELRTFVKDSKSGKEQAAEGSNDDYCMTVLIACRVDEDNPLHDDGRQDFQLPSAVPANSLERIFLRDLLRMGGSSRKVSIAQDLLNMGFYPGQEGDEQW